MFDSTLSGQMAQRQQQIAALRASGIEPYLDPDGSVHDQSHMFSEPDESAPLIDAVPMTSEQITVKGRLMQLNNLGKLKFLFLRCPDCDVQVCVSAIQTPVAANLLKFVSLGDHLQVIGHRARTTRGSDVLFAREIKITSKMIRPLPGKAYNVNVDDEWRANNRVADMLMNQQQLTRLRARAAMLHSIRQVLHSFNFLEVETSMLSQIASGATAKPFMTHHNALNKDMSLRIAPELDLKRLIIAGFDRVYELGRVFRNEGIDKTHNPEFTTLEIYGAHFSIKMMINVLQHLMRSSARAVSRVMPETRDNISRFETDFAVVSMRSLVREVCCESPITADERPSIAEIEALPAYASVSLSRKIDDYGEALQALFEAYAEKTLIEPTIVSDHPASLSPLAKHDGVIADRFELYVNGFEIANAYVEQADAVKQRAAFAIQAEKNASTPDMRYCDDLELGLPPTVGLGIGIDRLMMIMSNSQSIREVIAFPTK